MSKGRGASFSDVEGTIKESRNKRDRGAEPPEAFVLALADALRDILRDERRPAA